MNNISDIKHVMYINLSERQDRKIHVEEQLKILGIEAERFNAIKLKNGGIGCSMSHLKCLEKAKENNWPHVLIIEDDIKFLAPEIFKNSINNFLSEHNEWDVVLIGGNNFPPYKEIDSHCVKVSRCQTTTGYLVNGHYFDTLIGNIRDGIKGFVHNPKSSIVYAIDKYWFKLQEKDKWYLIIPLTVTQRADYSDIEHRNTNYNSIMLDLDKKIMIQKATETYLNKMSSATRDSLKLKLNL
jgi:glycosyl transferase family 25